MRIGDIWSFLAEKFNHSDNSLKSSILFKEAPAIPSHRVKSQRGYSVVVIGKSGKSHQYDLTPKIMGALMSLSVLVIVLSGLGLYSGAKSLLVGTNPNGHDLALSEKLTALQEELRNKEVALAVRESRLKEQASMGSAGGPRDFEQASGAAGSGKTFSSGEPQESLLASVTPAERTDSSFDSSLAHPESGPDDKAVTGAQKLDSARKSPKLGSDTVAAVDPSLEKKNIVNFNTQDVAISTESPGAGTLSFRLVKDHPNVLFSGYLFVFVEMEDKRGENKIYVYPDKTRLGEGDLPSDFKEGESISFKYNSRVELPYGDIRAGANLARVSILLYGENGKIVFQRGFEKKELGVTSASGNKPEPPKQKTASEKRRPL